LWLAHSLARLARAADTIVRLQENSSRHRDRVRDDDDDVIAASFIVTDQRAGTVFRDWGRADDNRYLRKQSLKPLGAVDVITVEIAAS